MKKMLTVRYAMTRNPVIVNPLENCESCAKKMLKEGVGSLIIEENSRLRGIATEKDFIEKIIASGLEAKKIPINKIMNSNPITIDPEKDIMEAVQIMNKLKVRRLPVVKDNKLLGLITVHDILKIQPELFDLIIEKSKINPSEIPTNEAECEICGNFTLVRKKKNQLICNECYSE